MNACKLYDRAAPLVTEGNHFLVSQVTNLDKPVWIAEASTGCRGLGQTGIGHADGNGEWVHNFTGTRPELLYIQFSRWLYCS